MTSPFAITAIDDLEREYSERAGAYNINLIEALDCTKLHPRMWPLSPGDEMSYHHHTDQEEFYYVVEGPGRIRIDGDAYDVPTGGAVRIAPEVPRQLFNDSGSDHRWLVVAAPARTKDGVHL